MIAIVKTTIDRKTGEKLEEQVLEPVDMTEDEYYRPLVEVMGNRFLAEESKEEEPA